MVGFYPGNEVRLVRAWCPSPPIKKDAYATSADDGGADRADSVSASSLTVAANSSPLPTLKPGYGALPRPTSFGLNAKRRLSRAGACLDEAGPVEEVLFLTGTLPGGTDSALEAIARWSAFIVHSLKKWVWKREKTSLSMYCWEYQRRGALHLHYAVRVSDAGARRFIRDNFKAFWYRLMLRVSALAGCDVFERASGGTWRDDPSVIQADAQPVRVSVARYLAKYLSKSVSGFGTRGLPCPSRWFGVSRPLSRLVADGTFEVRQRFINRGRFEAACVPLFSCVSAAEGLLSRYRDKSGRCECVVLFPASSSEFLALKKEVQAIMNVNPTIAPSAVLNREMVLRYWSVLSVRFKGFDQYCQRQNIDRYRWLQAQRSSPGITGLDTIMVLRWLMANLASYVSPTAWHLVEKEDALVSEHLLRCLKWSGDPYHQLNRVSAAFRSPNMRHTPDRRSRVLCQYRKKEKLA